MTGLDEVEGALSLRESYGSFLNIVRRREEALLIDRRIRRTGISVVHDLLEIAGISKMEGDEILGFPECDFLIRQFAGKAKRRNKRIGV